ncbi:MAG: Crp/Fnr family transcriptional regulator [Betaproteobacteria bacterium]|nr:Crp/Fnr family transcriptional regulator [Betaproteobacteria bacterium]
MQSLNAMLQALGWAKELSEDGLERVKAGIVVRNVPAGAFVCMKGEPVDHWMGVVEGLVKMACNRRTGKTTTFTGVPAGGWFGEGSLLKNEPRKYDVIALRDSKVAFMNRGTFQWLLDHSIPFNRFLIVQLNERLGQFIGMMEHERMLDVDARLARCLAALFNPVLYPGISRELQISQEEIGFLAGVSRQRVNRSLRKLEDAGLLRIDYGSITIVDLAGLRCFGE